MPLRPISELVQHAREHRYALGYFESWNLESLQGVLDAAEATRSPIIIGFNGEFLSHPDRKLAERLQCYAELGKAAAASASVPCGLIFNECPDDDGCATPCSPDSISSCRQILPPLTKITAVGSPS